MSRLVWGDSTNRHYQAGVDYGVFYNQFGAGKPWNGLISVVEGSDGDIGSYIFLDGTKLVNRKRFGDFSATVEAFSYPEELDVRPQISFGFSYRVHLDDHYQIHLVYNAKATIDARAFASLEDSITPVLVKLKLTTLATIFDSTFRTAHLIIDTMNEPALSAIEDVLYGSVTTAARLPTPEEIVEIFESHATIRITDNGDGTFTIDGPDELVYLSDSTTLVINSPAIEYLDANTFTIHST